MTKTFLSAFILVFSVSTFACKPAGLPTCKDKNFYVDQGKYAGLFELVKTYQGILTKTLKMPDHASSCFNNGFAVFYAGQLQKELKASKGKTCKDQVERVRSEINRLVDKKSSEFLTITDTSDKRHLRREAKKVKIAMICLP